MKHDVTKKISMIMVLILLLTAFAACGNAMDGNKETTPSVNAGQTPKEPDNKEEEQDDPTRVFTIGDLEPLSKEKQLEVEDAWYKADGLFKLRWRTEHATEDPYKWCRLGYKYYGAYNDCVAFAKEAEIDEPGFVEVAGYKFEQSTRISIKVYKDGEFYSLENAYECGWLSDGDVADMYLYHNRVQDYYNDVKPRLADNVFVLDTLEPLSKEKQTEVETAWNEKMHNKIFWCKYINIDHDILLDHRYYGTYNDCIVIFERITGGMDIINIEGGIEVGGQKIESWWVSEVWVYHNGEFIAINDAYENNLLSDDDISAIVKYNFLFEELEMGAKYDED